MNPENQSQIYQCVRNGCLIQKVTLWKEKYDMHIGSHIMREQVHQT